VNKSSTPGTCNLPQTCGSYEVISKIDSLDSITNLTYYWSALDSLGSKVADKRIVSFLTTTDVTSSAKSDVVTFSRSGKYILRHEVSNATGTRSEVYFDTITVAEKTYVKLPNDTTICSSEEFDLKPFIENQQLIGTYYWTRFSAPLQADSVTRITLPAQSREFGVPYSLIVYDSNWCQSQDEFILTTFPESQIGLDSTYNICRKDTLNLQVYTSFSDVLWTPSGDRTSFTEIISAGNFQVQVEDSFGCAYTDSFEVSIFSSPPIDLQDSIVSCGPHEFNSSLLGDYLWKTGDSSNRTTVSTTSDIWVAYTDTNGCISSDTSFVNVVITPIPVLTQSGDSIKSNITGKHLWFLDGQRTEEDQPSVAINGREGFFSAIYVDRFGCESDTSSGVEILLGVENLTADQIRVYPNPSSGRVMIEGLAIGTIKQVKLFDAQGRVVNRELDISRSTAELMWVSSPGVYVVEVTTDLGIFRKTIIQE
jgi:PKD repeat protein